VREQTTKAGMA